jgi:glycosyltransferase involved in cell wall biosynthesis
MTNRPQISVLMSVFNGESFLRESIDSILQQSFTDFEFIIINDYSTDSTLSILTSYSDYRIKIVNNDFNIGLTKSLNKGLKLALGKYIARIDADDIAYKNRLENQFNFLEKNKEIAILGTQAITNGRFFYYKTKLPIEDYLIKWNLFFFNPIVHPSVMYRTDIIKSFGGYNEEKLVGQDYDLWTRLFFHAKFANLTEPYIFLRRHKNNITVKNSDKQFSTALETINNFLCIALNKKFTNEEMKGFFFHEFENKKDINRTILLIVDIYNYFLKSQILSNLEMSTLKKDKNNRLFALKYPLLAKIKNLFSNKS